MPDDELGSVHDIETSRTCFLCHSVALQAGTSRPDPHLLGVGCESCHGPASAHIAAARTPGATEFYMEKIGQWGAKRINELCGRCHRTADTVNLGGTESAMTQRFQPYGLMQSPCFQGSGDVLSCLTCHDPHTNASRDERRYEAACLSCHAAAKGSASPATAAGHPTICPVNPKDRCIGCHMPPRKVFPFSKLPVYMADHLIWAYGKKQRLQAQPD